MSGYSLVLFDVVLFKVGCPIMQVVYGGSSRIPKSVGPEHWFTEPTDNMKLYMIEPKQEAFMIKKFGGIPSGRTEEGRPEGRTDSGRSNPPDGDPTDGA